MGGLGYRSLGCGGLGCGSLGCVLVPKLVVYLTSHYRTYHCIYHPYMTLYNHNTVEQKLFELVVIDRLTLFSLELLMKLNQLALLTTELLLQLNNCHTS